LLAGQIPGSADARPAFVVGNPPWDFAALEAKRGSADPELVTEQLLDYWAAFAGRDQELQTVRELWGGLTGERRCRVAEFVRDQHRLSVQERLERSDASEES
jgi:hypothetical protein